MTICQIAFCVAVCCLIAAMGFSFTLMDENERLRGELNARLGSDHGHPCCDPTSHLRGIEPKFNSSPLSKQDKNLLKNLFVHSDDKGWKNG